ncbi:hypothetical protein WR25_05287 [Diploscapter pachys]|uniref:Uncharacterized protein n=1 Tax=Diploscapter pachys TaxID=2018661 RepID=A0A2A2M2E1_9BILA|nr:hypothetical protein WR25_05287 [Diploscapter pachys]
MPGKRGRSTRIRCVSAERLKSASIRRTASASQVRSVRVRIIAGRAAPASRPDRGRDHGTRGSCPPPAVSRRAPALPRGTDPRSRGRRGPPHGSGRSRRRRAVPPTDSCNSPRHSRPRRYG